VRDGAREILVAAQKNGQAHGIDPDTGEQLWRTQVGRGGNQGGTHFGIAAEGSTVFVPMSDYDDRMLPISEAKPGIFGVDAFTGAIKWSAIAENRCGERENCDPGVSAAVTAIPGVVFAGHMDSRLRAYDTANGTVLWEIDADRTFETISGAAAHGGSFGGGSAPIVKDGHLYVNSGYGIYFHMPGNVLLVFSVDGK
ncbi:MAG: PQQ-binding-like beta-propeller repeat protein, partial [Pseudomonadales bacterium]